MIIMKLNGGLGNQMFEYAYGRALQEKYDDSLFLDIEEFRRSYGHEPRHFSLNHFKLSEKVSILPINKSKMLMPLKVLNKINRNLTTKIGELFNIFWWRNSAYKEFEIKETKKKKCYFYGYWQSEQYFKEIKEIIKEEFTVKDDFLDESKQYLQEIQESDSVCVHIRRGDFVLQNMIVCDEKYYLCGMDYIINKYPDALFFVFTDDKDWVFKNIHFRYPVRFVELQKPDFEVLRLMYLCKHFVISNSSFSWWAQYLGRAENKIVVAPQKWHLHNPEEKSIYNENWVLL